MFLCTKNLKAALGIAAYIVGVCALCGCTSDQEQAEDAELVPYAIEANMYIGQHFGTQLSDAGLDRIHLICGETSEYIPGYVPRISIWRGLRGQPDSIRAHMRHELFHAVSELSDDPGRYKGGVVPQVFNGIRIADWVAWRE